MKILFQKKLEFDEAVETFSSTYNKLNEAIIRLFYEHREEILKGQTAGKSVTEEGSYHSVADFMEYTKNKKLDWNVVIAQYKRGQKGG